MAPRAIPRPTDAIEAAGPPAAATARRPRAVAVVAGAIAAYLLLSVVGFVALRMPGAMAAGNELPADRAVFAAANAVTLTGFPQNPGPNDYRPLGRMVVLGLTAAATILTLTIAGMAVARVARLAVSDRAIAVAATGLTIAAGVAGVAVLAGHERGVADAMLQGVSAFGNSGVFAGRLPLSGDWRTHVLLLPLAVVGGLGVAVVLDLFSGTVARRWPRPYPQLALALTGFAYLVGLAALLAAQAGTDWRTNLLTSSAAAVNARSAGFPLGYAAGMTRLVQWVLVVLMIIGPVSGGAGGGIKLTTLAALVAGARRSLRGNVAGRAAGIAIVWIATYAALVFATLLVLIALQPQVPADRLLFLAVSAASNVGLAHEPVAMAGPALIVLSTTMLLGRVLPIVILWWQAGTSREADVPVG